MPKNTDLEQKQPLLEFNPSGESEYILARSQVLGANDLVAKILSFLIDEQIGGNQEQRNLIWKRIVNLQLVSRGFTKAAGTLTAVPQLRDQLIRAKHNQMQASLVESKRQVKTEFDAAINMDESDDLGMRQRLRASRLRLAGFFTGACVLTTAFLFAFGPDPRPFYFLIPVALLCCCPSLVHAACLFRDWRRQEQDIEKMERLLLGSPPEERDESILGPPNMV